MADALLIHKEQLQKTDLQTLATPEISQGDLLLKITRFAFTTNNLTYAVMGFRLRYWEFFPAPAPYGIIPVWGYAEVVESQHEAFQEGELLYGYFPTSEYLKVTPARVTDIGFVDSASHRQDLPPIYNYYYRTAADLSYQEEVADYIPILRPLFTTGFLSYYFLKEAHFKGIEQIFLTSASSKTALGLAYMLHQNQGEDQKKIIGLTSPRNVDFVQATGYYDQVIAYEDIEAQLEKENTLGVDFAGNTDLLTQIDQFLGDQLSFISLIGLSDWQSPKAFQSLEKASFFFAPDQARQLFKEWGEAKAHQAIASAMLQFIQDMQKVMKIALVNDPEKLQQLYLDMLGGKVDPRQGYLFVYE